LLLLVPSGVRSIAGRLPVTAKMALSRHPYQGAIALLDDCAACAADQVIDQAGGPAWDAEGFARLLTEARSQLAAETARVVDQVARVLAEAHEVEARLAGKESSGSVSSSTGSGSAAQAAAFADMRAQFSALIYPGFVAETGARRLPDLVRYLRAMARRLDKLPGEAAKDAQRMATVHRVADAYQAALAALSPADRRSPSALAVRWQIEELRVSLFAQVIGTAGPVSEKRILTALDALTPVPG
jgi:ATP-dependent helicase HrpA